MAPESYGRACGSTSAATPAWPASIPPMRAEEETERRSWSWRDGDGRRGKGGDGETGGSRTFSPPPPVPTSPHQQLGEKLRLTSMSDLDITDQVLAELRSAADIVEVIGEHTRLKKAGRSWKGLCPF